MDEQQDKHNFFINDRRNWYVDKSIPLATILTIFITYTSLVVWVVQSQAAMDKRVYFVEYVQGEMIASRKEISASYDKRIDKLETRVSILENKERGRQ